MLRLRTIESIAFGAERVDFTRDELAKVEDSHSFLTSFAANKIIYGINTGFGPMAQYRVDDDKLRELQYNIIRSHACGAGQPLPVPDVRAAMVARMRTFLNGKSGVHPEVVLLLRDFINHHITPVIPEHGSVGASGDLVQLAHLALSLIGEGEVFYKGERRLSADVMAEVGLKPMGMHIREGLAVTNGTAVMTGIGLNNLIYAKRLMHRAVVASVMMNEVAASYDDFMAEELNSVKRHEGQKIVAQAMRRIAGDSKCLKKREVVLYDGDNTDTYFAHKLQPFYSLRCVPQILGPVCDTLAYAENVLVDELNSADDNPIVDGESGSVLHGGNFHGDYVSLEMDKVKIAITRLTMLMERQLNYLLHDKVNEMLPPFLNTGVIGLNYGFQALQFTATSTTAESQTLSNPVYVHSIPCNNDNQDIVSMGTNSALMARRVIDNAFQVMAIHYMALAQAVDCLDAKDRLSTVTRREYDKIRAISAHFSEDTPKYTDIERMTEYVRSAPENAEI